MAHWNLKPRIILFVLIDFIMMKRLQHITLDVFSLDKKETGEDKDHKHTKKPFWVTIINFLQTSVNFL